MKYDKDAVVKLIEGVIVKAEKNESDRYRDAKKAYKNQLSARDDAQHAAKIVIGKLQEIDSDHPGSIEDFWTFAKKVIRETQVYNQYGRVTRIVSMEQLFDAATAAEPEKPEKDTERSDRLKTTLEIFKTGAPPEVGVTDLKSFGFMEYVKRGGL